MFVGREPGRVGRKYANTVSENKVLACETCMRVSGLFLQMRGGRVFNAVPYHGEKIECAAGDD